MTTVKTTSRVRELTRCVEEVARFEALPPKQRGGRPLFLAFIAVQRHADLAADGAPIPESLNLPAIEARRIVKAMAAVASRVVSLDSVSRAADLPKIRQALGLSIGVAQARAKERKQPLAAAANALIDAGGYGSLQAVFRTIAVEHNCSVTTVRRAWLDDGGYDAMHRRPRRASCTPPPRIAAPTAPIPEPAAPRARDRSKNKAAINRLFRNDKTR